MLNALKLTVVSVVAFLGAACQETFEDDYHLSSSVHGEIEEMDTKEFFDKIQQNAGG
jgi:hypothetical protein